MTKAFEGHASEMKKNTTWLSSEDLLERGDVKVTIEGVFCDNDVEFDQGRKEPVVYSVKFKGKTKRLVLNATNRRNLVGKFGANVSKWKDQEIVLYVDPNVRMMGKVVMGIRIR